ncbi:MAG TPA: response regulator [Polyangia bacterium]|nr:response regulator [Polyangia bacterium]
MTAGTVVIVDDDEAIREGIRDLLEAEGYRVVGAADGTQGLDVLRRETGSRVAIIDLSMPTMDGVDMMKALQADAELAAIPVLVCTAWTSIPVPAGAFRVLYKPFPLPTLLHALAEAFESQAS